MESVANRLIDTCDPANPNFSDLLEEIKNEYTAGNVFLWNIGNEILAKGYCRLSTLITHGVPLFNEPFFTPDIIQRLTFEDVVTILVYYKKPRLSFLIKHLNESVLHQCADEYPALFNLSHASVERFWDTKEHERITKRFLNPTTNVTDSDIRTAISLEDESLLAIFANRSMEMVSSEQRDDLETYAMSKDNPAILSRIFELFGHTPTMFLLREAMDKKSYKNMIWIAKQIQPSSESIYKSFFLIASAGCIASWIAYGTNIPPMYPRITDFDVPAVMGLLKMYTPQRGIWIQKCLEKTRFGGSYDHHRIPIDTLAKKIDWFFRRIPKAYVTEPEK
jgi:DNA-binding phage protein